MPTTLGKTVRDSETHPRLTPFDQPALKALVARQFKIGKPLV